MPRSGYTICTSEQRPTSTTVSHGFVVERYSSPPFGSHGPRKHSKPCPLDSGSGNLMQNRDHSRHNLGRFCFHHALGFRSTGTVRLAGSKDSLVRVSRRAGSGTVEARSQGQAPLLSAPRSHWGIGLANRSDHQQAGAVTVGPPTPPQGSLGDWHARRHARDQRADLRSVLCHSVHPRRKALPKPATQQ